MTAKEIILENEIVTETITIDLDGKIYGDFFLEPEVLTLMLKYKSLKDTQAIPINSTINNILRDYLLERLKQPLGLKLNTLDKYGIEPGY